MHRKSIQIHQQSTKNQQTCDVWRFWALKAGLGRRRDTLGTGLGRQKTGPGPILGRPGRAKSAWEPAKSLPRSVLGRSWTTPERSPSALGAPSAVEHARGAILRCFWRVEQKLAAQNSCAHAVFREPRAMSAPTVCKRRKTLQIMLFWPPKLSPGAPGRHKIDRRRARSSENARSKCLRGLENLKVSANEATSSEKARPVPPKSARSP